MLRRYKIRGNGFLDRIAVLLQRGLLGIAFGMLIFLLIIVGALWSASYAKKFGRGYLGLDNIYNPPRVGLLHKIFHPREGGFTKSPAGENEGSIHHQRNHDNGGDHQYQEDGFYQEEERTEDEAATSSVAHPLGTDGGGRDILERLLAGCRVVFLSGVIAVSITLLLGTALGIFSGYLSREPLSLFLGRKKADEKRTSAVYVGDLVNLFPTVVNIFPRLVLVVIILSLWKEIDIWSVVIAIGIINVPKVSYIIKDKIEHLKNQEFIEAARELGVPHSQIILKHILWYNCRPIILVQTAFIFAEVILVESSLSYLGYGLADSWGRMVARESGLIFGSGGIYWPIFFPAAAIVLTIIAFQALGDGLSRWFQIKS
jgi:ABC-type dipeptide/oligopeptide/nickel transport system permease subunit